MFDLFFNNYHVALASLVLDVRDILPIKEEGAASCDFRDVFGTEIDRVVPTCFFADYKTRYTNSPDARRLCAMFSDDINSIRFFRHNMRRDTDILT